MLKCFNCKDEIVSFERPIKGAKSLTEYARISSYHEWIWSTTVQYKLSATLKVTHWLQWYTNVHVTSYIQCILDISINLFYVHTGTYPRISNDNW